MFLLETNLQMPLLSVASQAVRALSRNKLPAGRFGLRCILNKYYLLVYHASRDGCWCVQVYWFA